ncbi:acyl-CoA desaturase [Emticicia sp. TH156]|uniref:fatty acid desaturase family protein n=1 Tax=Emticicia sp. TH156 TaxID=2067454 RepID=UPI000C772ABE|nr:acyl-CoA desaturase [Emticicia sp. TH156]PLK44747.1 acyl-CoA desaturase [Emticicia sp. TH156]
MKPSKYSRVKFLNKDKSLFFSVLRSKVDSYFHENQIQKTGGQKIMVKAICMLSLYLGSFALILSGQCALWQMWLLTILMGVGVAGVGMSVMHDAIHGSFSEHHWINRLFGASLYLLGGNVYNWEIQHNRLHHTFTNIHEVDEDITGKFLLRLSCSDKLKRIHRFQHIYAFFLYSLMTLSFLWKDFKEIALYNEMSKTGLVKSYPRNEIFRLLIGKVAYILVIGVLPMVVLNLSFGQWLIGFMTMHAIAGLILSTIFQLAHVVEGAHQPSPDEKGNIENSWAIHQLNTTSNFASRNYLLSWYIGGLDYQIEHHLFPHISHVHYRYISPIVRSTAEEYGILYNDKASFINGLDSHIRMLKHLGKLAN